MKWMLCVYLLLNLQVIMLPACDQARHEVPTGSDTMQEEQEKVYVVVPNGKKYHRANCQFVKGQVLELTLQEAQRAGYTPCKKCEPPE